MKLYFTPFFAIAMFLLHAGAFAQSKIKDGTVTGGSGAINANAVLEAESANKGFLLPRVALSARNTASPLSAHVAGMTVYNTASNGSGSEAVSPGYYYNDGAKWVRLVDAISNSGDIKYGIQNADHNGWVKLNGRAISTLTASQQAQAAALGLSGNLPNADSTYLVQNGAALLSVTSSNTRLISQDQLPDVTLPVIGTTDVTGAHTHSYTDRGNSGYNISSTNGANPIADNTNGSYNTGSAGDHSHTVTATTSSINGGVTQQMISIIPKSLSVNVFIYLGL